MFFQIFREYGQVAIFAATTKDLFSFFSQKHTSRRRIGLS